MGEACPELVEGVRERVMKNKTFSFFDPLIPNLSTAPVDFV
jgi:hypothetical protein